jgi:hypothetical protein
MSTLPLLPAYSSPVSTLPVRPWPDDVIDALGHDPRSTYVELFWLVIPWETGVPERCPPADN